MSHKTVVSTNGLPLPTLVDSNEPKRKYNLRNKANKLSGNNTTLTFDVKDVTAQLNLYSSLKLSCNEDYAKIVASLSAKWGLTECVFASTEELQVVHNILETQQLIHTKFLNLVNWDNIGNMTKIMYKRILSFPTIPHEEIVKENQRWKDYVKQLVKTPNWYGIQHCKCTVPDLGTEMVKCNLEPCSRTFHAQCVAENGKKVLVHCKDHGLTHILQDKNVKGGSEDSDSESLVSVHSVSQTEEKAGPRHGNE